MAHNQRGQGRPTGMDMTPLLLQQFLSRSEEDRCLAWPGHRECRASEALACRLPTTGLSVRGGMCIAGCARSDRSTGQCSCNTLWQRGLYQYGLRNCTPASFMTTAPGQALYCMCLRR